MPAEGKKSDRVWVHGHIHQPRDYLVELLRSDLHNLFDLGYLTVTLDYRVEVSRRIREEFENGRHYYALHGQSLAVLPRHEGSRPALSATCQTCQPLF